MFAMKTFIPSALMLLASAGWAQAQQASGGNFAVRGSAEHSGGGTSRGGAFSVTGVIGQPAAGALSGGTFQIAGGLIGVYALPTAGGDAALTITRANGSAIIGWDKNGYVLETRMAFGAAGVWEAVTPAPIERSYTTPINQPARFFRLRKEP